MELRVYARVLRRGWLLVLTLTAAGGLLAAVVTWQAARMYAATVTMVVSTAGGGSTDLSADEGGQLSAQRVRSYAKLVASDRVAAAVIGRLHLTESPDLLRSRIVTQAVPDTLLLRVSVRDSSAPRAERLADAVGTAFSAAVAQVEAPGPGQRPAARVTVWEAARPPAGPVTPRPARNLALGLLCGLVAGLGAMFVRYRLFSTRCDAAEAAAITGRPTFGSIVFEPEAGRRPLIAHASPHSPRAEGFRQLRANLRFAAVDGGPHSIIVTSSGPDEGRSTTCCNLAITLAQAGARVCLLEGDLRRPSFAGYLGVDAAAGLTSVLIGAADLDDVLQPWRTGPSLAAGSAGPSLAAGNAGQAFAAGGRGWLGDGCVDVLPSGPVPPDPGELLGSRKMAELLDQLCGRYDVVLVDAPPLLAASDAAVLAGRAGGTLLVVRIGRTSRARLRRATAALRSVDARVLGTVLNMVPPPGLADEGRGLFDAVPPRGLRAELPVAGHSALARDAEADPRDEPVSLAFLPGQRSDREGLMTGATTR
ncbi:protein tyrosine kinase [Frankia sp. AgB1.9]|uniref:polysaccharide biosynthesis tyrosine autokinase n=1 Tax=unclassified Frankia TaxID=2632575 RepID=UPI001934AC01|nr:MULTISPECIES: polysaccharide biosynthesis tyrosine autokinase [unclassified Frankia]MBL7490189.1 protein tyrosine kinase [Frankia sp. AgW1.1]MBL7553378.1 protein tyrosine kinase [Frankia sp. AgB1.9]MBL7619411.1 protein tyrosine kinase [Frankia sp. AgB1.8]